MQRNNIKFLADVVKKGYVKLSICNGQMGQWGLPQDTAFKIRRTL